MSTENTEINTDPHAPTETELEAYEAESTSDAENSNTTNPESQATTKSELQKQVEKLEKEFRLKVNGKEVVEKIDLNDEQRIIKALQMEKAAQEAFQKASAREKELAAMNQQLDQFFELLKTKPLEVLMNPELGLNAEELANKILDMKIEDEMKDPKDKELEAAKAKLAEFEKKEREAKEEAEKLRLEKLQSEYEKEVSESINAAIEEGELPESPYILSKFAYLLDVAIERKLDVNPKDLIPIVKEAYLKDMRGMIGKLPDEIVEEIVNPDRIRNIRNKRIQAVKQTNAKLSNQIKVEDTAKPIENTGKNNKRENFWKKMGEW